MVALPQGQPTKAYGTLMYIKHCTNNTKDPDYYL